MSDSRLVRHLKTYESYHRHPVNRAIHAVGLPLIVFHVAAMLCWIPTYGVVLAGLVCLAILAWYATMHLKLATIMAGWFLGSLMLGLFAPTWTVIAAAVLGWGMQFLGHAIWEKRSPALLDNLVQALVGPLYLAAVATGRWPRADDRP